MKAIPPFNTRSEGARQGKRRRRARSEGRLRPASMPTVCTVAFCEPSNNAQAFRTRDQLCRHEECCCTRWPQIICVLHAGGENQFPSTHGRSLWGQRAGTGLGESGGRRGVGFGMRRYEPLGGNGGFIWKHKSETNVERGHTGKEGKRKKRTSTTACLTSSTTKGCPMDWGTEEKQDDRGAQGAKRRTRRIEVA